jgi:hypothetical protein
MVGPLIRPLVVPAVVADHHLSLIQVDPIAELDLLLTSLMAAVHLIPMGTLSPIYGGLVMAWLVQEEILVIVIAQRAYSI